jgi:hypothetical protein
VIFIREEQSHRQGDDRTQISSSYVLDAEDEEAVSGSGWYAGQLESSCGQKDRTLV